VSNAHFKLNPRSTNSCRDNFLALFALLLLSGPFALAEDTAKTEAERIAEDWYQIEFALFEHQNADKHTLRYQDLKYVLDNRKHYYFLVDQGNALSPYQLEQIDAELADLNEAVRRLKASREVKLHVNGGWRQAIQRDVDQPPLKIKAGKHFGDRFQLEGELTVRRSRYMHVDINVFLTDFKALPYSDIKHWLFENDTDRWPLDWLLMPLAYQHTVLHRVGQSYIPENTVHLKQTRRIKDGEIHYMDHPVLGLIATVKKVEAPFEYGDNSEL